MISIVGLGVVNVDQVTPQVRDALHRTAHILYRDRGLATDAYLRSLGPPVTRLDPDASPDALAAQILDAALTDGDVALALSGHPTLGEPLTAKIHDAAAVLQVPLRVVTGPSSLDAVLATVLLDPLAGGLQLFSAQDLVTQRRTLLADVPLCVFGAAQRTPSTGDHFQPLRDHLLQFWEPSHPCLAVHAASHPLATPAVHRFSLGELCAWGPTLHPDVTLVVPV